MTRHKSDKSGESRAKRLRQATGQIGESESTTDHLTQTHTHVQRGAKKLGKGNFREAFRVRGGGGVSS